MAERTIILCDMDAEALDRLVKSGRCEDEAEALHESLKFADLGRTSDALREAAFLAAVQVGLDDVEAGRVTTLRTPEELGRFLDDLLAEPLDDSPE